MKYLKLVTSMFFAVFLLSSCDSPDRIAWSPDGKRVAVLAADGLRLGDDVGALSNPVLKEARLFRWMPDSNHALLVTNRETNDWNEVKQFLSPAERAKIPIVADKIWKYEGDPEKMKLGNNADLLAALAYLNFQHGKRAVQSMLIEKFNAKEGIGVSIYTLQMFDLSEDRATPGLVLYQTRKAISDVRLSPTGKILSVAEDQDSAHKITIIALQGGARRVLASLAAGQPDWSPDGTKLFYISTDKLSSDGGNKIQLGSLVQSEVEDKVGKLSAKFGAPKSLGAVPFRDSDRIRVLPDGSVVFSSSQFHIPCAEDKFDESNSLFKLSADFETLSPIATTGDALGNELDLFEVNQTGTKLALPGNHGEVTVLDLGSLNVTTLEHKGPGDHDLKFTPQWRLADELCFASRAHISPGSHALDVVLKKVDQAGSENSTQILSKNWPAKLDLVNETDKATSTSSSVKRRTTTHH